MLKLYDYQERSVAGLREHLKGGLSSPLLVSPTGSGKTVMFAYMAGKMEKAGASVYILAHRIELIEQISRTLEEFDVPHGIISPAYPETDSLVQVASVFTLARRLKKLPPPNFMIIDEAHHATLGSTWGNVITYYRQANPRLRIMGVTATPERLSGEPLGDMFDSMFQGPPVQQLIDQGYLSPYRIFAPPKALDTRHIKLRGGDYARDELEAEMKQSYVLGNAVEHYREHLDGKPTVAFCVSVKLTEVMAERMRDAGYNAVAVHGKVDPLTRKQIIEDFSAGNINYLASCDLISEGFDVPGIHGVQLLRPTESLGLYLQQVGRSLRKAPGKERAIILDHVGNSRRHGLPCDSRDWTLAGKKRKGRKDPDDIAIAQCPECGAVTYSGAEECPECGAVFERTRREIEELEGVLEEVDKELARKEARKEQGMAHDLADLVALGKKRGYKNPHGWAYHVHRSRVAKARRHG